MFTPPKVIKQPMLVNSSDDIVTKKAPQCERWWTAAVQDQPSGCCHAPLWSYIVSGIVLMSGKPKRVCELTMVFGSREPRRSCLLYHSCAAQAQRRREGAKKGVEEQRLEQTDVFKKLSWQMKTTKNKLRWYRQQPQRLFLQIFLKRAHARKQKKGKNELLRNLLCNLLRNLLRNLLGTFSETRLNLTWLCTNGTFSGTFSGLSLTWLCTKAWHTFSGTFSQTFSGTFSTWL